jgi:hypothetical protein
MPLSGTITFLKRFGSLYEYLASWTRLRASVPTQISCFRRFPYIPHAVCLKRSHRLLVDVFTMAPKTMELLVMWASKPAVLLAAVAIVFYTLYRRALPKPYPGIPHNVESTKRLAGDAPNIMALANAGRRPRDFWANLCIQKSSPITQFFPGPFISPIIVISDFREVQDLLIRRSKETDRAYLSKIMWSGVGSHHFVAMDSKDPRYPEAKQLVKDIMGPTYLATVSSNYTQAIDSAFLNLSMLRYHVKGLNTGYLCQCLQLGGDVEVQGPNRQWPAIQGD